MSGGLERVPQMNATAAAVLQFCTSTRMPGCAFSKACANGTVRSFEKEVMIVSLSSSGCAVATEDTTVSAARAAPVAMVRIIRSSPGIRLMVAAVLRPVAIRPWRGQKKARRAAGSREKRYVRSAVLAAQADHDVDARDLVPLRRLRHLIEHHGGAGNIEELVIALHEEVVVIGGVGIEIAL